MREKSSGTVILGSICTEITGARTSVHSQLSKDLEMVSVPLLMPVGPKSDERGVHMRRWQLQLVRTSRSRRRAVRLWIDRKFGTDVSFVVAQLCIHLAFRAAAFIRYSVCHVE
jgi:hypothetical protein